MNPTPEEVLKIMECQGVIGIIFDNYWLCGQEEDDPIPFINSKFNPGMGFVIKTIDSIHSITGNFDSISVGSDLDGFTDPCDDLYNIAQYKLLRDTLSAKYGADSADKILGGNIMRVLQNGWGNGN